MSASSILSTLNEKGVATLTLNYPEQHNAFNEEMIQSIISALNDFSQNTNVKMLVLQSTGKTFCAGASLQWMKEAANYTEEENLRDAEHLGAMMYQLAHFPKPTLAMVQGNAFGGGIGLMACCDIVIAAKEAQFCFSEVKLGIIPAVISPYVLRAIGQRQALAYFLSSKAFSADVACQMGLCHEVVAFGDLNTTCQMWIDQVLLGGPLALTHAKRFISGLDPLLLKPELVKKTAQLIAKIRVSSEAQEGLSAFLQKRKPHWTK